MNNQETTQLCRYVRALCPQQKFDEYTPDAWHDILGPVPLDDAREAAARVARRQPFVAPAEILAEVGVIRGERLDGFVYEPVERDDNPRVYLAAYRGQREAVASGHRPADPTSAPELTVGPHTMARVLEGVGRQVPSSDTEPELQPGPLTVACPTCAARPGKHCQWATGTRRPTHVARRRTARGEPAVDPQAAAEEARRRTAAATALAHLTPEQRAQMDAINNQEPA
ncbi:hypothetical protein [Streptomyces sp. NPDC007083]|uniref:zinc finger domain-containing protein n=1 Tax=Streptomyces sp. NPDC007083 TaxID=3156913 RepID=UPI0033D4FE52